MADLQIAASCRPEACRACPGALPQAVSSRNFGGGVSSPASVFVGDPACCCTCSNSASTGLDIRNDGGVVSCAQRNKLPGFGGSTCRP